MSSERQGVVLDFAAAKRRREQSNEPWVKKEVLAEEIAYSTRSIYRFVAEGAPVKRLRGGTLRFQVGPFKDWLEQREQS